MKKCESVNKEVEVCQRKLEHENIIDSVEFEDFDYSLIVKNICSCEKLMNELVLCAIEIFTEIAANEENRKGTESPTEEATTLPFEPAGHVTEKPISSHQMTPYQPYYPYQLPKITVRVFIEPAAEGYNAHNNHQEQEKNLKPR